MFEVIKETLKFLSFSKKQYFLLLLFISISTSCIAILFSITETVKRQILNDIENMGGGVLELAGGFIDLATKKCAGLIKWEDLSLIKRRCRFVKAISMESCGDRSCGNDPIIIEGRKRYFPGPPPGGLRGILPDYKKIKGLKIIKGRFINDLDVRLKRRVCVIGNTTYTLLGDKKIIGKKLKAFEPINQPQLEVESFTIIGVLAKVNPFWLPFSRTPEGEDFMTNIFYNNALVFIPYPVIKDVIEPENPKNKGYLGQIYIQIKLSDKALKERLGDYTKWEENIKKGRWYYNEKEGINVHMAVKKEAWEIISVLKEKYGEDKGFLIYSRNRLLDELESQTKQANTFILTIGIVSLLASIISILSLMLLSVTNRTSEIGLRRAIGARKRDIFLQFLKEALVITGIGGMFGVIFGIIGIKVIGWYASLKMVIPIYSIFISIGTAIAIGVIGGVYPAIKASNIPPAEAVRYE